MSTPGETSQTSRGLQFFILACTLVVIGLGTGATSTVLQALVPEFGLSFEVIGIVTAGVFVLLIVFLALGGRLRAVIGDKSLLLTSTCIFIAATVLEGLAPSFSIWALGRLFHGAATGCLISVCLAFAADNARRQWRGDAIGVLLALYFVGTAIGPYLGGYIAEFYSWRDVPFASAVLGLVLLVLQAVFVTAPRKSEIGAIFD